MGLSQQPNVAYLSVVNCDWDLKGEYTGEALRGMSMLLSSNANTAQVVDDGVGEGYRRVDAIYDARVEA